MDEHIPDGNVMVEIDDTVRPPNIMYRCVSPDARPRSIPLFGAVCCPPLTLLLDFPPLPLSPVLSPAAQLRAHTAVVAIGHYYLVVVEWWRV